MRELPQIPTRRKSVMMTSTFFGLNKGLSISEGEFADMKNLSPDQFPVLTTRQKRAEVEWREGVTTFENPQGMIGTDKLVIADNGKVYVDGEEIKGITLSTEESMQPKHMVGMGAYVCIWPDKKYIHIHNPEDCGDMGSTWAAESGQEITAVMCRKDGRDYDMTQITVGDTAPETPEDEQLWLDTSGEKDVLKQYSAIYQQWIQVATTYIKIQAPGIGKGLKESDVAWISGAASVGQTATVAEGSEESLVFTAEEFSLKSKFSTGFNGSSYVSTTASIATRTQVITVSGIPDGAKVVKAVLHAHCTAGPYGAALRTVNGITLETGDNDVEVEVPGNGDVSFLYKFQSYTNTNSSGSHTGGTHISNITLTVTYEGAASEEPAEVQDLTFLNTSNVIYGAGDDYIIVAGILSAAANLEDTLKVEMKIPDLDYVCEANNRIWGCAYSEKDGVMLNELRACALGDFRNWYRFEGTSMDSYTASVGTEGVFTGATSLRGSPIFFKENVMHRIVGTQPSNFTLTTQVCRGVQEGCWRSLAFVGETLFYKARTDVMMYDGSLPVSVSEKLGQARYAEASAGVYRDKYYISMQDAQAGWHLFVFDAAKGLWHEEDASEVHHFATVKGDMHFIQEGSPARMLSINGLGDAVEDPFDWSATFGIYGFDYEGRKYLSRFNLRAQLAPGAFMKMEIMYDSNGVWVDHGTMRARRLQTFLLPIIPRRCDHCQVRLSGEGEMKLYSIARELEGGGDGIGQPQHTGGWI